jgi:hypothetical protein
VPAAWPSVAGVDVVLQNRRTPSTTTAAVAEHELPADGRAEVATHVNDIQTDVNKDDLKIEDEPMGSEMGVKTEDLEE